MTADQHYRNVTRNGWASMPGELIAYACNLCSHMEPIECDPTALRQVRTRVLNKARSAIRAHIRDQHPHLK
jgi:hypothetical protein